MEKKITGICQHNQRAQFECLRKITPNQTCFLNSVTLELGRQEECTGYLMVLEEIEGLADLSQAREQHCIVHGRTWAWRDSMEQLWSTARGGVCHQGLVL